LIIFEPKVRPAPLEDDISESEESNNSEDEDEDDCNDNNRIKNERNRLKRKRLQKFRRKFAKNLALERDVILPVLRFVSKSDLLNCMRVCKLWNGLY
jgi:hypothetical protein